MATATASGCSQGSLGGLFSLSDPGRYDCSTTTPNIGFVGNCAKGQSAASSSSDCIIVILLVPRRTARVKLRSLPWRMARRVRTDLAGGQ
jgi:hypothetical protein